MPTTDKEKLLEHIAPDGKLYDEVNLMEDDLLDAFFALHMESMTSENLHDKAEIAKQLAVRDFKLHRLLASAHLRAIVKDKTKDVIEQIYYFVNEAEADAAIDVLFEYANDLYMEGEFDEVGLMLDVFDLDRLGTTLVVAVLSISFLAKDQLLACRKAFVKRAKPWLLQVLIKEEEQNARSALISDQRWLYGTKACLETGDHASKEYIVNRELDEEDRQQAHARAKKRFAGLIHRLD